MRVNIKRSKDGTTRTVIITFNTNTEEFASNYERNKFFRELHGWQQTVPSGKKRYTYRRSGILDGIPHAKIADSVFMIMEENMKQMQEFFSQWEKKVDWEMHRVSMEKKNFMDMIGDEEGIDKDDAEAKRKKIRRIEIE